MDKQVSLCIIKKNEWKDNYSLRRIADLHEEKLEKASFPNGKYKWLYYDNRTAPTIEDMVGFWEWKETIQQRYGEEKVWIQSDYLEECAPIEVWFPIGLKIGRGIFDNVWKIPARIHGSFLMAEKPETSGRFQAVLCCLDDCQITPTSDGIYQNISLRNDIYTLPYYVFYLGRDIISWKENLKGDDKRYFFNRIKLGEAQGRVVTHSPMRTIQKEMESWLKGQSISQNDRRTFKRIMQMIPPASIAEKLQEKYEIPEDDAQKWVQSFLQQTVSYIDMNDIDADLVANVILNHPKLRDAAEVKMEKQWVEANQKKIAEGEKRCEQLKLVKEKLNEQIAQYQKELTIKQKECSDLNQDIGQYKVLREEVREETRKNLEEIRGHMGKFLADYAAFNAAPAVSAFASKACGWKWRMENDVGISTAEADKAKNWEDILDGVIQNLSCSGVASEWEDALGAYLYAAYVRIRIFCWRDRTAEL